MSRLLDLADIQGGILRDYGHHYPKGRYIFIQFRQATDDQGLEPVREAHRLARAFVQELREKVTSALRWESKAKSYQGPVQADRPNVTTNVAFTFHGLRALGLPIRTLQRLPDEFINGMAARASVLGDVGANARSNWDDAWRPGAPDVHVLVLMRAGTQKDGSAVPELDRQTEWLLDLCERRKAVLVTGHRGARYQDASLLMKIDAKGEAHLQAKEHFGFSDGISEVAFDGQGADLRVEGGGKITGKAPNEDRWLPHALGEFLLGHPDESQELPPTAPPAALMRNGTFMAYRKLHQNVKAFRDYVAANADAYAAANDCTSAAASEILKAKMVGRWQEGVPLSVAPTVEEKNEFLASYNARVQAADAWKVQAQANGSPADSDMIEREHQKMLADARRPFIDFTYHDDPDGIRCPVTAHIRRTNTRDMLDPQSGTSILNNRRRILRRGLPYGMAGSDTTDEDEHGVVFLAFCASLFRQFEFIQQQWLNYGARLQRRQRRLPPSRQPPRGQRQVRHRGRPEERQAPFICANLPQFVETRGSEYFFVPSLTALRMMAMGTVDPT